MNLQSVWNLFRHFNCLTFPGLPLKFPITVALFSLILLLLIFMTSSMLIQESWTWHQLFFFNLDRPVNDLAWKISHGVLYIADRLASFGYDLSTTCFCSDPMKSLQHLFFHLPLAISVLSWLFPCVQLFCFIVFCRLLHKLLGNFLATTHR